MDNKEIRRAHLISLLEQAKENGQNNKQFAEQIGLEPAQISHYKTGLKKIGDKQARNIERQLGLPPDFLDVATPIQPNEAYAAREVTAQYGVDDNIYAFVRKYAVAGGMGKASENGFEEVDGRYAYRRDWLEKNKLHPGACVVIDAEGESMYPSIHDGDTVLINTAQKKLISGRVFAFRTAEGVRIKRLFRQLDGRVRVVSDNPDKIIYPDEYLAPGMEVDIIGLVVHRSGGV